MEDEYVEFLNKVSILAEQYKESVNTTTDNLKEWIKKTRFYNNSRFKKINLTTLEDELITQTVVTLSGINDHLKIIDESNNYLINILDSFIEKPNQITHTIKEEYLLSDNLDSNQEEMFLLFKKGLSNKFYKSIQGKLLKLMEQMKKLTDKNNNYIKVIQSIMQSLKIEY